MLVRLAKLKSTIISRTDGGIEKFVLRYSFDKNINWHTFLIKIWQYLTNFKPTFIYLLRHQFHLSACTPMDLFVHVNQDMCPIIVIAKLFLIMKPTND